MLGYCKFGKWDIVVIIICLSWFLSVAKLLLLLDGVPYYIRPTLQFGVLLPPQPHLCNSSKHVSANPSTPLHRSTSRRWDDSATHNMVKMSSLRLRRCVAWPWKLSTWCMVKQRDQQRAKAMCWGPRIITALLWSFQFPSAHSRYPIGAVCMSSAYHTAYYISGQQIKNHG